MIKDTLMKKFILACFGLLLLAVPAALQAQYTWTTNNGAVIITGYTGPGGAVTIPATITGVPVTSLGNYAFSNLDVTSVTILEGKLSRPVLRGGAGGNATSLPDRFQLPERLGRGGGASHRGFIAGQFADEDFSSEWRCRHQ
jgi:hypothetical protein